MYCDDVKPVTSKYTWRREFSYQMNDDSEGDFEVQ